VVSKDEQLRDGLTSCGGCGCLSLQRCALSNPGDTLAASGRPAPWRPAITSSRIGP
jgi:MerR family redox-sensitive transcriptional activator SoxR